MPRAPISRLAYALVFRVLAGLAVKLPRHVGAAVLDVRSELALHRRHRAGVRLARQRYRGVRGLQLHLGCGDQRKAGFVNIDRAKGDLTLDLREQLPFEDGACVRIYSEHFLEHVDYPDATLSLLRECHRVLTPGGVIDIGVPDTEWPLMEYAGVSRLGYFETAQKLFHPSWCQTRLEHLHYHFRQGTQHRMAYDFETLAAVLKRAGFVDVRRRNFSNLFDSPHRELGTLYVVAERPEP